MCSVLFSGCEDINYEDYDDDNYLPNEYYSYLPEEYYSVSVISPIYDGGEDFIFTLTRTSSFEYRRNPDSDWGRYVALAQLNITNAQTGETLQQIEDIEIFHVQAFSLSVADANFDGFNDVIVGVDSAGAQGALIVNCWLWNYETRQFEYALSFPQPNASIDTNAQVILTTNRGSAVARNWYIHKFMDGEFVLTNSMYRDMRRVGDSQYGEEPVWYWRYEQRTLINGVWEEEVIYLPEHPDEYPSAYGGNPMFREGSIWNPRQEDLIFLWNN